MYTMVTTPVETPPAPAERNTYTVPEAATLLGTTPRVLRAALCRGEFRFVRIGRCFYLSRVDVDRLLAGVTGDPTT